MSLLHHRLEKVELGLHHFGFLVEDPQATHRSLEAQGALRLPDVAIGNQYFEVKFRGPDGVVIDVAEHGWVGARGIHQTEASATTH